MQDFVLPVSYTHLSEIADQVIPVIQEKIRQEMGNPDKLQREQNLKRIKQELLEEGLKQYPENEQDLNFIYEQVLKETMRSLIVQDKVRPDGRQPEEIRNISCQVSALPRTHGSACLLYTSRCV